MLPHKKDQSFISTPVSRVGSSARLNHLSANGSRPASRPGTPGAYVTSSLNPARNLPVTPHTLLLKLHTPEELAQFENLPVVDSLRKFETSFNQLLQSITSFNDKDLVAHVTLLIHTDGEVSRSLEQLESHSKLGKEIQELLETNLALDAHAKTILKELISCRAKLRSLPKRPASKNQTQPLNNVDVQTVLDYAMKLAKFSKTPATVQSHVIHPNNYIWPAEDALRRGMLAMASLKPEELLQAEIGQNEPQKTEIPAPPSSDLDVEMEDVEVQTTTEDKLPMEPVRGEKNGPAPPKVPMEKPAVALDLDLFDADAYDDDSD